MSLVFPNRIAAGHLLAEKLASHAGEEGLIVLALPRGGVPVAAEIAHALGAPLDVLVVRKIGAPGNPEFGVGAVASGGLKYYNTHAMEMAGVSLKTMDQRAEIERAEVERREHAYRGDRPSLELRGRPVILVDDGIATGSTMRAAVSALHGAWAGPITVAAPVAARESYLELRNAVRHVVVLTLPRNFACVADYYEDFTQTSDAEVRHLLDEAWHGGIAVTSGPNPS
ncbi:MAG TPA: phosphoribosyltransferase [Lacunisphaera sp.]|jgi:putative phosphoribosyl transferase|nr:phosphoribosyltransferase [Lacunisphaera sp.]